MLSKISYNSSVEKKNERVNIESDNSCSDRTLYRMLKFSLHFHKYSCKYMGDSQRVKRTPFSSWNRASNLENNIAFDYNVKKLTLHLINNIT